MAEEIAFENGWISNCEWLMTVTLDSCLRDPAVNRFGAVLACERRMDKQTDK